MVKYTCIFYNQRDATHTMFEVILTVHRRYYVEIKCQLDATDDIYCRFYFIARSTCFGQYYAHHQELECIIQMVFAALVLRLSVWCGAECYVSGLQPANRTHNLQLHTIPTS